MLKGQKLVEYRRERKSRAVILPKHEARCGGKNCEIRTTCKRYLQLQHETQCAKAVKGDVYVATYKGERIGFCERRLLA